MQSESPFTSPVNSLSSSTFVTSEQMSIASQLGSAQRGLLVIAHLASHQDVVAALKIAQALRWPVVADALSGKAYTAA